MEGKGDTPMMTPEELVAQFKFTQQDDVEREHIPMNLVLILRSVNEEGNGGVIVISDTSCDSVARLGMIQAAAHMEMKKWTADDDDDD